VLEFNGHEISNESNFEWSEEKVFAPKVESKENTYHFSKDETLIEEKSILIQKLILRGMKCLMKLILRKMIFL
jgi:hypothetical protein